MKYLKLLFLLLVLSAYTFTQGADDNDEDFLDDDQEDLLETPESEMHLNAGSAQEQQEQQRQIVIGCIILTQHYAVSKDTQFKEVLDSHQGDQQTKIKVHNKVVARLLDICYVNMPIEQAQKLLGDLRGSTFDVKNYEYVYEGFKWEELAFASGKVVDLELTPQEQSLFQFKTEFEKAMKDREEKSQENNDEFKKVNPEDYEPKIAGLSMSKAPKSLQIAYLVGIIGFAAFVLIYGLMYLQQDHKLLGDKKKKKAKKE